MSEPSEHVNYEHIAEQRDREERRMVFRCAHCDSQFVPPNTAQDDDWCYCICHNTGEF